MPIRNAVTSGLITQRFGGLPPPAISNLSGIINTNTNTTITINGSRFLSTAQVIIGGAGVSGSERALTTTFVSSTQLTATTNAASVNFVSSAAFDLIVQNGPGARATLSNAGTVDPDPTWSTAAGSRATFNTMSAQTITHQATDPQGVTISLASGSLPSGLSLASNGNVSGTVNWSTLNGSWSTTYNYTLRATDNTIGDSVDRAFSITVNNSYYYRQVYSYAYFVGGYSSSNPHFAAHRTTVSNDAYAALGDRLTERAGYVGGAWSDTGLWVYGCGGGLGAYSNFCGLNMFSETQFNNGGMPVSKDDTGVMGNHGARVGTAANYVVGGGEVNNLRHTFASNSIAYVSNHGNPANYGNAWESDSYGYDCFPSQRFNFSNETWSGMPSGRPPGSDQAHSKSMSTKDVYGFAFVENAGNSSYTYTRHNWANETLQNNWTNKPQTCGETNFGEGQDWGYGMGCCGSACQNNWYWRQQFNSTGSTWLGGSDRAMSSGDSGSRRA